MITSRPNTAVEKFFFLGLVGGVTLVFFWMLRSYLLPVLWAVVFAILLYPIFRSVLKAIPNKSFSALVTIIIALGGIFAPLTLLAALLTDNAISIYQEAASSAPAYVQAVAENRAVRDAAILFDINVNDVEAWVVGSTETISAWVATQLITLGTKTLSAVVKFFIMLYLLFFFLKDGERVTNRIGRIFSLGGGREKTLFNKFSSTIKAIFKGTIVVALVQGLMGAFLFWFIGIDNPFMWGALMAFLSIIPAVGPAFVWVPASIITFSLGDSVVALLILAGGLIISITDNILKPVLVGKDTKMPDPLILLSIFGGLMTFGIAGFIIGPVIAALFLAVWHFFEEEYKARAMV